MNSSNIAYTATSMIIINQQNEIKKLKELLKLSSEIILGSYPDDDDCRYDHNGNCQEHSFFGLDGNECPVSEFKRKIREIKL